MENSDRTKKKVTQLFLNGFPASSVFVIRKMRPHSSAFAYFLCLALSFTLQSHCFTSDVKKVEKPCFTQYSIGIFSVFP